MTPRRFLGAVVFPLALLAAFSLERGAARADGRPTQKRDHIREPLRSLTFESISGSGMVVYQAEFGRGYVDFNRTFVGQDGKAELHSFHMRY